MSNTLSSFIAHDLTETGTTKILGAEMGAELYQMILTGGTGNGLLGAKYTFVQANGNAMQNMAALISAYASFTSSDPGTPRQPKTIILGPGEYYNMDVSGNTIPFLVNKEGVDIVTLTGNADAIFVTGINVTANNVYIKGIDCGTVAFQIGNNLNLLVCENCKGGSNSFCNSIVSGTFIKCIVGIGSGGTSRGFGTSQTFSGIAIDCESGAESFGGNQDGDGVFNGYAKNCKGGDWCFGHVCSGFTENCTAGDSSFGTDESGGSGSFSGTSINCEGGAGSFCSVSGTFTSTGRLNFCKLTSGGFPTVTAGGHITYCINGDGTAATNQ